MRLAELTSELKDKVVNEVFFNEYSWVITFQDGTAITLGLREYKTEVISYMDKNNIIIKIEKNKDESK